MLRWQLEVTYQEVRARLGVETRRQWSDRAIARNTPILMGLFPWIALSAHGSQEHRAIIQRTAAWFVKPTPILVDAMDLVRRHLWTASHTFQCRCQTPTLKNPRQTLHPPQDSLAYDP